MREFAALYRALDETTKTNAKVNAMAAYFSSANPEDAAWAIYFLSGEKLRQVVPTKFLREWAAESAGIPQWLFDETYNWVGDLAETLSLVQAGSEVETIGSLADWVDRLKALSRHETPETQREFLSDLWSRIGRNDRFVLMKLITGAMRVGVSRKLVIRALSECFDLPVEILAHRLMGDWLPTIESFSMLIDPNLKDAVAGKPYPFCLANPVPVNFSSDPLSSLGVSSDYLVEWKWDGIRAQLIRRRDKNPNSQPGDEVSSGRKTYVWSRGEERLDGRFPEIERAACGIQGDFVLDGELLGWDGERPLPFMELQKRLNRKRVGKKLLDEVPVIYIAFDLLESNGVDFRDRPQAERRRQLENLIGNTHRDGAVIRLSESVSSDNWSELAAIQENARAMGAEGLMLKHLSSPYQVGRVRGHWWKWKVDPFTIDGVLIYAQRGHGRRASLYSDYTFALWHEGQLVPFAKAYSGLTDDEIRRVDRFVRQNTNEKFGPVRSVTPALVMELAFENMQKSPRHKSGLAVRFPRIVRWRHDKKPVDANQLDDLKAMLLRSDAERSGNA